MTDYHIKHFDVNASLTKLANYTGSSVTSVYKTPNFYYKDQMLITWTIKDLDGDPVVLTGATFTFRIISSYSTQNILVSSDNSQFISGDWSEWSLAGGKICCRVDLDQGAILTYLGSSAYDDCYCGLWATVAGVQYLLCQFNAYIRNTIS